jgi:hypothetical protein
LLRECEAKPQSKDPYSLNRKPAHQEILTKLSLLFAGCCEKYCEAAFTES